MTNALTRRLVGVGLAVSWAGMLLAAQELQTTTPPTQPPPAAATSEQAPAAAEALLQEGIKLFDSFEYEQSIALFDRAISLLPASNADLLVQAYELRARARFALGDSTGAEADFASLLAFRPGFTLAADISPRVVAIFEGVKRLTVGQLALSMSPVGEVAIDGTPYTAEQIAQPIDLVAGEHVLTATRGGYRSASERFAIKPGERTDLLVTMERVSATLSLATIPDGVEIVVDGIPRGVTPPGDGLAEGSGRVVIDDLTTGPHRIEFRRDCFATEERQITVERPEDLSAEPVKLAPAVATAVIEGDLPDSTIYLDGKPRGPAPAELNDVCAGAHVLEVRAPRGRFMDKRDWKAGESVTLKPTLRPAFAVISSAAPSAEILGQVESTLAGATRVLVFTPSEEDLAPILKEAQLPEDWLAADPESLTAARPRRDARRTLSTKVSSALDTQGVATVTVAEDSTVSMTLVAAGSAEPEILRFSLDDQASKERALRRLGADVPPVVRPSMEASVVDVAGRSGAAIVRSEGVAANAGLTIGDVVTGAGGAPVASVADLRKQVASLEPNASLPLEVQNPAGQARSVALTLALAPDTIPLRDPELLYSALLAELKGLVRATREPIAQAAARLNLAIVQLRLGNADEALQELQNVKLPDGPGVSAGTVAYLEALALEALGRSTDARAALGRAANSPQARLSVNGPSIASLAALRQRALRP